MKDGAITYGRVSTEEQVGNTSLSTQKRVCRKQANELGCKVIGEYFDEGVSGAAKERPELHKMMMFAADNKDKIKYLIVKSMDRLARDTGIYISYKTYFNGLGINVYSIAEPAIAEDTPSAELIGTILSSIHQFDRKNILKRTKDGMLEMIARGGWVHQAPYGYDTYRTSDNIPSLKPNEDEAKVVKKIFELYARGMNVTQVAQVIKTLGYRTRKDKSISFQVVDNMLHNPIYIGKIKSSCFPDNIIDGLHSPIVTDELWNKVIARSRKGKVQKLTGRGVFFKFGVFVDAVTSLLASCW